MVSVLGDGSVSTPTRAVPPSSCTWKVKLASMLPVPFRCSQVSGLAAGKVGNRHKLPGVHGDPIIQQCANLRHRGDLHSQEVIRRVVILDQ